MGILTTGQNVWDTAVEYADMTNSQFPAQDSTTQLRYVNNALSHLHYRLANGDNKWFAEQAYFQVVAAQEFFPLPDGTNYQRTVLDTTTPKKYYRLTKLYFHDADRSFEIPRMYRHETYGFTRTPLVSGFLDMLYVPEFVPLTSLSGSIDTTYPAGWEDYAAIRVARRLLKREESVDDAALWKEEYDEVCRNIDAAVASRDSAYPQRIEDTTGRWQWARRFLLARNYENNYSYIIEGKNLIIVQPATLP